MNTTPTAIAEQQPLRCPSHNISRAYKEDRERQQHVMATGPYLAHDGYTLIVPSEWYNPAAAEFWKFHGFHWNKGSSTWERDTRLPLIGKCYATDAWLESTRRQFYEFWPTLLYECKRCHARFARTNQYDIYCIECRTEVHEAHKRRFHN